MQRNSSLLRQQCSRRALLLGVMQVLKERFKGRVVGFFQHCILRLIILLPPNEFRHSSPEAPRTTQARETSASEGRNYQGIQLTNPEFRKYQVLLHAAKLGHGTDSFTSPPKEGMLRIYSDTRKIQRLRPGSNPRTRVPEASMLTTKPPKPLTKHRSID